MKTREAPFEHGDLPTLPELARLIDFPVPASIKTRATPNDQLRSKLKSLHSVENYDELENLGIIERRDGVDLLTPIGQADALKLLKWYRQEGA